MAAFLANLLPFSGVLLIATVFAIGTSLRSKLEG